MIVTTLYGNFNYAIESQSSNLIRLHSLFVWFGFKMSFEYSIENLGLGRTKVVVEASSAIATVTLGLL